MHYTEYALIVAGGKGRRIPGHVPKQFRELNGLPILMHTISAFHAYNKNINIILVLPEDEMESWNELCKSHAFNRQLSLVAGGPTRFQSVKRGLGIIKGEGLVAIHDGVRPIISVNIIEQSFKLAARNQSAVASVPMKESIRQINENGSFAVDRTMFRLIQTPQTFDVSLIKHAYELPEDTTLTDDASIAERAGHKVFLFDGSYENIKITTMEDLAVAEALLRAR